MTKRRVNLAHAEPRSDLLMRLSALMAAAPAPAPTDEPAKPADDAEAAPAAPAGDAEADSKVTDAIAKLKAAVEAAKAAQAADPDATTDPTDQKVTTLLDQASSLVDALEKAQSQDNDESAGKPAEGDDKAVEGPNHAFPGDSSEISAGAVGAQGNTVEALELQNPANPPMQIVDDKGNVHPDAVCADQECGHFASGHADTEAGDNTGACEMANCTCAGFKLDPAGGTPSDPAGDDSDGTGDATGTGGPDNAGGGDAPAGAVANAATGLEHLESYPWDQCIEDQKNRGYSDDDAAKICGSIKANNSANGDVAALADLAPITSPIGAPAPSAPAAPAAADVPQLAPDGTNPPPAIEPGTNVGPAFYAVLAIEGQQTSDGRGVMLDALDFGTGLPLMGLATAPHDPSGMSGNDPAIWCGRIDTIERQPGENGTNLLVAHGHFLNNEDGLYFADLVEQMGRAGISADIGVSESTDTIEGLDDQGLPIFASYVSKGAILGGTVVPFPAFGDCYIVLGDGSDGTVQPVQAENAPEAVTAAAPHFIDLTACVPCATGKGMTASAAPVRPPREWFDDPHFTVGDGRLVEIFTGRGERRFGGQYACPLTITDQGEVYGHIAPWGVCHTGMGNTCQTAPHSKADYRHFKRAGQVVLCDDGTEVNVGALTFAAGHADLHSSASMAMAHYDNVATAWAHVNVGEDEHGIWVHGAVLPDVSEETLRRVRASSPSGDWRTIGGNYELVGILSVNQPGFPVSLAASNYGSLVAAGAYLMQDHETIDEDDATATAIRDEGLRRYLARHFEAERDQLRQRQYGAQREIARMRMASLKRRNGTSAK